VVIALRRSVLPHWLAIVGYAAAALIATGVVIPLIEPASLTNFAGYVTWCAWLLAVSGLLLGQGPLARHSGGLTARQGHSPVLTGQLRDPATGTGHVAFAIRS
jgi:hypothetical protein